MWRFNFVSFESNFSYSFIDSLGTFPILYRSWLRSFCCESRNGCNNNRWRCLLHRSLTVASFSIPQTASIMFVFILLSIHPAAPSNNFEQKLRHKSVMGIEINCQCTDRGPATLNKQTQNSVFNLQCPQYWSDRLWEVRERESETVAGHRSV